MTPDALPEPIVVAGLFAGHLNRIGVRYVIGGPFASSVHGSHVRRTTSMSLPISMRVTSTGLCKELPLSTTSHRRWSQKRSDRAGHSLMLRCRGSTTRICLRGGNVFVLPTYSNVRAIGRAPVRRSGSGATRFARVYGRRVLTRIAFRATDGHLSSPPARTFPHTSRRSVV